MSEFQIIGQLGAIVKKQKNYLVNIAENKYIFDETINDFIKIDTIWYNCLCSFTPNLTPGDKVIALGTFEPSKNDNFPFAMKISHIAKIIKK